MCKMKRHGQVSRRAQCGVSNCRRAAGRSAADSHSRFGRCTHCLMSQSCFTQLAGVASLMIHHVHMEGAYPPAQQRGAGKARCAAAAQLKGRAVRRQGRERQGRAARLGQSPGCIAESLGCRQRASAQCMLVSTSSC